MSDAIKPLRNFLDQIIADQTRRGLSRGGALDINALDDLDPVHVRRADLAGEFDYDGDMGREHSEYLRDNGIGGRQSSVAGTFVQIAAALPLIEAPGIVPDKQEQPAKLEDKNEKEEAAALIDPVHMVRIRPDGNGTGDRSL